jgi:replicative DNA helicase
MTKHLDDPMDGVTEAKADPDRHHMEEAVLATLAKGGPDDPFQEVFLDAYINGTLTFSRSDLDEVAKVLMALICVEGRIADEVIVRGKLQSIPAVEVLPRILGGSRAVDTDTARAYIGKLHELDMLRGVERLGDIFRKSIDHIKTKGGDIRNKGGDIMAAMTDLAQNFYDVTAKKLTKKAVAEAEAAKGFFDILDARRGDGRDWTGLDSGFRHLNEILNGLSEGVIVLNGMPSCGKTTLAKQIADYVAEKEKVPVLFYSFEQSAEELRIKSLARLSLVDSRVIWKGRTGSDNWERIEKANAEYLSGPGPYLTIIEAGLTDTVEAIRAEALTAKRKAGVEKMLLILDYLQIIPAAKDAPDALRERVDWNLSELRRLSRDLQSPVMVVSALSRGACGDPRTPPTMTAMKESGGIECSADAVIALWRDKDESEHMTRADGRSSVRVEAHVLKNRNGELAKVKLDFMPAWALFTEAGKEGLSYDAALGK